MTQGPLSGQARDSEFVYFFEQDRRKNGERKSSTYTDRHIDTHTHTHTHTNTHTHWRKQKRATPIFLLSAF